MITEHAIPQTVTTNQIHQALQSDNHRNTCKMSTITDVRNSKTTIGNINSGFKRTSSLRQKFII